MKKLTALFLATLLITTTFAFPVTAVTEFTDVPNEHWAYQYITQMVKEGAVNGYIDGTFAPNNPVTRAEFCKMVILAAGKELPTIEEARNSYYTVPGIQGHWGELYLAAMSKDTWTYDDWFLSNDVKPDEVISRGEAAMGIMDIWYGYPRSYGEQETIKNYLSNKYKDADTYGGFENTVYEVSIKGFMSGYDDECFHHSNPVTRAELCAILYRTFSKYAETNLSEDTEDDTRFLGSIILKMDRDTYMLYRTVNNRLQKINGTPYLSEADLQVRMNTNLGDNILQEALNELKRTAPGWGMTFTANIIYFVQNDIEYLNDPDDRDYAKYPYETLYDRGGDCEDKAILMCSLLYNAGYDVCLIVFSDHVAVGVAMTNDIENGYYYTGDNGTKYYYLETTSYGWEPGEMPDDYIDQPARLLFP